MKCAFRDDLQCDVRERRAGRGTNLATLTVYYKWAPERPHSPLERIHTHNPACARHPTLRTLLRFSMLRTISFSYIFLKYGDCVCFYVQCPSDAGDAAPQKARRERPFTLYYTSGRRARLTHKRQQNNCGARWSRISFVCPAERTA